jgi:hypothetical protein
MIDIVGFAAEAATRFEASREGIQEQFALNLPREAVENLIKAAYYGSQIPDEGRWPRVTLMCYRKGCERDFHVWFESRVGVNAVEIAKLSHSVSEDSHICCISDWGKLTIDGLHIAPLSSRRDLGYSSFRITSPLKVKIQGPGHIDVSTGGIALVYKAGEMSEESLFQHSTILKSLTGLIEKELKELTEGTVENLEALFNDLAKGIVRTGHGGLVLLADQQKGSYFSSLRKIDLLLLQQLLVRYWNSTAALLAEAGGVDSLLNRGEGRTYRNSSRVVNDTEMLEKCVRAIGRFSGMDGAIALNVDCKVVAFNAIIKRGEEDPKLYRFIDNEGRAIAYDDMIKNRGSRHQSALGFAMRVPGSFAFVISQDGFISAFQNKGHKTIMCERGMRVLE